MHKKMSSDESGRFVQIPKFDGTRKNYPMWKVKMRAVLAIKRCAAALDENFESKLPATEDATLDESDPTEKAQKEAVVQNALGMNIMTLAMETDQLMAKVSATYTDDFPSGLLCKLWKSLQEEYEPDDTIANAELLNDLMKLRLKKGEDPTILGENIAAIQSRYKCKVSAEQKIAVVVNTGGASYAETIRQEQRHLKGFGKDVTAELLIRAMHDKWRISSGGARADDDADNGKETQLNSVDCPKFRGKCYNCGQRGHKADDCWELVKNAHKRPKGWKSKERNGEEAGGACVEIMLSSIGIVEESS